MANRASAAGWVVQITIPGEAKSVEGAPWASSVGSSSFHFYNVALPAPEDALEAATHVAKAPRNASARIVRSLSAGEIAAIRLPDGQAKPA